MQGEANDGPIEVAAIMTALREKVRGRRDRGLHSDDEVDELTALKLQAFADEAEIDPELLARLMAVDHGWNISVDYRIQTHRRGRGAQAIVWLKRAVRPWVRLYTDHVLNRQAQINLYLRYVTHHLVREVVRLQLDQAALRRRLEALEQEKARGGDGAEGK